MAISIWDKPATLTLAPFPFEKYALAGAAKQKTYDEGEALMSSIDDEFYKIKVLPIDEAKRDAKLNEFKSKIEALYSKAEGDYGKMAFGLKELQREVKKETTYGDLAGMMSNYQEVTKAQEDFEKAATDGKFSGLDDYVYKASIQNPYQKYISEGGYSRDSKGIGKKINIGPLYKMPEVGKTLSDMFQQYTSDKYPQGLTPYYDPNTKEFTGYFVKGTTEFVDKNEVIGAVMTAAYSLPEFKVVNQLVQQAADPNEQVTLKYTKKNPKTNKNEVVTQTLTGPAAGIYNFYKGTAEVIGEREAFKKVELDYIWDKLSEEESTKTSTTVPLNVPYTQVGPGSVMNTIDNLKTTVIQGINSTPVFGGSYGPGMGMSETEIVSPDYSTVYNDLSFLDKNRIDFIKTKINLPADVSTWKEAEWKKAIEALKPYATKKVSSIKNAEENATVRKTRGEFYNANMEDFVYYDPNNNIGLNKNRTYTGTELRNIGIEITEYVGDLSNANIVPSQVAGTSYTFAKPDIVNVKSASGQRGAQLYVGKNPAQVDNNYRIAAFENALTLSNSMGGIPYPLFNHPNIIVVSKGMYNYDIKLPDNQTITIKGDDPVSFRTNIINLYNKIPALQELIELSIFGNQ